MTSKEEIMARDIRLGKVVPQPPKTLPPQKPKPQAVDRTSAGLRDALFDAIDGLRAGTLPPDEATALAKLSREICATVKLEIDVHRLKTEHKDEKFLQPAPLALTGKKGDAE